MSNSMEPEAHTVCLEMLRIKKGTLNNLPRLAGAQLDLAKVVLLKIEGILEFYDY